jgi:hypothetical protein
LKKIYNDLFKAFNFEMQWRLYFQDILENNGFIHSTERLDKGFPPPTTISNYLIGKEKYPFPIPQYEQPQVILLVNKNPTNPPRKVPFQQSRRRLPVRRNIGSLGPANVPEVDEEGQ